MTPFCSISEAAQRSGWSAYAVRLGCRDGSIPTVRAGEKYLVNYAVWMESLGVPASWISEKTEKTSPVRAVRRPTMEQK